MSWPRWDPDSLRTRPVRPMLLVVEQMPSSVAKAVMMPPLAIQINSAAPGDADFAALVAWVASGVGGSRFSAARSSAVSECLRADGCVVLRAVRGERTCGAVVASLWPDGTAEGLGPQLEPGEGAHTAHCLLSELNANLSRRTLSAIVFYPPPERLDKAEWLCRAGYAPADDLLILASPTDGCAAPAIAAPWSLRRYQPRLRSRVEAAFARSEAGGLDFPEIPRGSTPAVLERLARTGDSGRELWFLVEHAGRSAGCLLLADQPQEDACQLVYLGLVSSLRGLGGGTLLTRWAQHRARRLGRRRVMLGVAAGNDPAIAVYASAGFVECGRRRVFFSSPGTV